MKTAKQLIDNVAAIGQDARALLEIARNKAASKTNLSNAEINRIRGLIERSKQAVSDASERAKARRLAEIEELKAQIADIEVSLSVPLDRDIVEFLKREKRNLQAKLLDRQTRVALEFGGILSTAEFENIQQLLVEARQAVRRRKKAAGFIKSLFQIASLSARIVQRASGIF